MNMIMLREKCQSPRKAQDTWWGLNFARRISIYMTVFFVRTGVHAMGVTTVFLLCGIASAAFFALGGRLNFFIGALLLQLWYILDHVDGEVARYFEESSLTGVYYDEVVHYIVHPAVLFGIGFGLLRTTGSRLLLLLGAAAALGIVLLSVIMDLKKVVILEHRASSGTEKAPEGDGTERSFAARAFSAIHLACTFPAIMNVITVSVIIDLVFRSVTVWYVLAVYAALINLVWISRLFVFIKERRVDKG